MIVSFDVLAQNRLLSGADNFVLQDDLDLAGGIPIDTPYPADEPVAGLEGHCRIPGFDGLAGIDIYQNHGFVFLLPVLHFEQGGISHCIFVDGRVSVTENLAIAVPPGSRAEFVGKIIGLTCFGAWHFDLDCDRLIVVRPNAELFPLIGF